MSDENKATDATRVAIECLTLWLEPERQKAAEHIAALQVQPDGPGASHMIAGMLNLSMFLVLELVKARGAEDLRGAAGEYLRHLSPRLPE